MWTLTLSEKESEESELDRALPKKAQEGFGGGEPKEANKAKHKVHPSYCRSLFEWNYGKTKPEARVPQGTTRTSHSVRVLALKSTFLQKTIYFPLKSVHYSNYSARIIGLYCASWTGTKQCWGLKLSFLNWGFSHCSHSIV